MSGLFSIAGHLVTIGFYGACGLLVSHILPTLYFLNIIVPNAKNGVGLGVIQVSAANSQTFDPPRMSSGNETPSIQQQIITVCSKQ